MAPDVMRSGRSLVLRMYAGGEGVESVALQAVNVFGHCSTEEEWQTMAFLQSLVSAAVSLSAVADEQSLCLEYRVTWVRVPPEAANFF